MMSFHGALSIAYPEAFLAISALVLLMIGSHWRAAQQWCWSRCWLPWP